MKRKIVLMLVVVSLMAGNAMANLVQDASFETADMSVSVDQDCCCSFADLCFSCRASPSRSIYR